MKYSALDKLLKKEVVLAKKKIEIDNGDQKVIKDFQEMSFGPLHDLAEMWGDDQYEGKWEKVNELCSEIFDKMDELNSYLKATFKLKKS